MNETKFNELVLKLYRDVYGFLGASAEDLKTIEPMMDVKLKASAEEANTALSALCCVQSALILASGDPERALHWVTVNLQRAIDLVQNEAHPT